MLNKFCYYILFLILIIITFNYTVSFEVGWNELLKLRDYHQSILSYLNPFSDMSNDIFDRGPIEPALIKILLNKFGIDFTVPRIIFSSFYLLSIHLYYLFCKSCSTHRVAIVSSVLLATNLFYFEKANLLGAYGLDLLMTIALYTIHFGIKENKQSFIFYNFIAFLNLVIFFTSALPVAISYLLIYKNHKSLFKKYYLYSLPVLAVFILKCYMVVRYRLIHRVGKSIWFSDSWFDKAMEFIGFFSINNPESGVTAFFSLVIVGAYGLFLYKCCSGFDKSERLKFLYLYLLSFILSFIAFNLIGAREIKVRYYFGVLPLFYLELSRFFLNYHKNRISYYKIFFISILMFTQLMYLGTKLKESNKIPFMSIYEILYNLKIRPNTIFCLMPSPQYSINQMKYISSFSQKKINIEPFKCMKIPRRNTLVHREMIITHPIYEGEGGGCSYKIKNICINEYFENYVMYKKIKIPQVGSNRGLQMSVFKKITR